MANHSILGRYAFTIYLTVIINHKSQPKTVVQGSLWCYTDPVKHSLLMNKSDSYSWKLRFSASLKTIQIALDKSLSISYLSCYGVIILP